MATVACQGEHAGTLNLWCSALLQGLSQLVGPAITKVLLTWPVCLCIAVPDSCKIVFPEYPWIDVNI